MKKLVGIITLFGILALVLAIHPEVDAADVKGDIVIFHAGSLAVPFAELAKAFETQYPKAHVVREADGSRNCARKVTELGRKADIVASADYDVIKTLMMPEYASWYINFASNEMVIMYTPHSKFANEINSRNWFDILARPGVQYGHSEPNADPCGYRTHLVWKLAEKYYQKPGLYKKLNDGCPDKNIRPKETDLLALLEAGQLDYIFIYRSVALQHHMPFVTLPDNINLKSAKLGNLYSTVSYDLNGKNPGEKVTVTGSPMVYGVTIPTNAPNRAGALAFIKFMLSPAGKKIIEANGQPTLSPAEASDIKKIPSELRSLVKSE